MNPFQAFQPNKRKEIGSAAQVADSEPSNKAQKINSFRSLLSQLNDDPFDLSISSADLKVPSAEKAAVQMYSATRKCTTGVISAILPETGNMSLQRQITIEANFDIRPLFADSKYSLACKPAFVYPSNQRDANSYRVAEYAAENISKTRHWSCRASELPYLDTTDTSGTSMSTGSVTMMTASAVPAVNTTTSSLTQEGEAAIRSVQSHLLKWQDALHDLLARLLHGNDNSTSFYLLGRSVLLPPQTRAPGTLGAKLPLPHTSALFYQTPQHQHASANGSSSSSDGNPAGPASEPACLLIGVQRAMLLRLQQLGVIYVLVEDINSPLPLSQTEAKSRGKSAVINIANNKTSVDPHTSTAAQFNSRKLGVDVLVRGRYAVTATAQALTETVFDILQSGSRAAPVDAPVLFAKTAFVHAVPISCDKRPIQCQRDFDSLTGNDSTDRSKSEGAAGSGRNDNMLDSKAHKMQLVGLFPADALPTIVQALHTLAQRDNREQHPGQKQQIRRKLSKAYAYLQQGEGTGVPKKQPKQPAQSWAMPDLPRLGAAKPAAAPAAAAVNPMTLVTSLSRSYAPEEEQTDEGEVESEGEGLEDDVKQRSESEKRLEQTKAAPPGSTHATAAGALITQQETAGQQVYASNLRAEEWLRLHRDNADVGRYFHVQCTLVTPRMGQFSYAAPADAAYADPVRVGGFDTLSAMELTEEIRWSSALPVGQNGDVILEVVSTVLPPARLRCAVEETQDELTPEVDAGGMVLDALNKYSIFVENKVM
jgi:hypothetical protein